MCGGSGRIPYLQQQLKEMFPNAEILSTIPSDEVIATGAAKQASVLHDLHNFITSFFRWAVLT